MIDEFHDKLEAAVFNQVDGISSTGINPRIYRVSLGDAVITMSYWSHDCIYVYLDDDPNSLLRRYGPLDEGRAITSLKYRLGLD